MPIQWPLDTVEDMTSYLHSTFIEILVDNKPKWVLCHSWSNFSPEGAFLTYIRGDRKNTIEIGYSSKNTLGRLWPDLGYRLCLNPIPQAVYIYRVPIHDRKQGFHSPAAQLFNPLRFLPSNFRQAVVQDVLENHVQTEQLLNSPPVALGVSAAVRFLNKKAVSCPLTSTQYCLALGNEQGVFDLWYRDALVGKVFQRHGKQPMIIPENPLFQEEIKDTFFETCQIGDK